MLTMPILSMREWTSDRVLAQREKKGAKTWQVGVASSIKRESALVIKFGPLGYTRPIKKPWWVYGSKEHVRAHPSSLPVGASENPHFISKSIRNIAKYRTFGKALNKVLFLFSIH